MPGKLPTPLRGFHITHVNNLPSIIATGWMLPKAKMPKGSHADIAYDSIQGQRAVHPVTCGKKGVLHDYVPFYFCERSPMLYAVNTSPTSRFLGEQNQIVHLVVDVKRVAATFNCVFTDGQGIRAFTQYYDDFAHLTDLDWDVIGSWSWKNRPGIDEDRKRRKQAEFLVHDGVPWGLIETIGVMTAATRDEVLKHLVGCKHQPSIEVRPKWYYR